MTASTVSFAFSLLIATACVVGELNASISNVTLLSNSTTVPDDGNKSACPTCKDLELRSAIRVAEALRDSMETKTCSPPWRQVLPTLCLLSIKDLRANWRGAQNFCLFKGGFLPLPKNAGEAAAILKFANDSALPSSNAYIRLRRPSGAANFTDEGGKKPAWLPPWREGQPNEPLADEVCVFFYTDEKRMELFDRKCWYWRSIVCQKRLTFGAKIPPQQLPQAVLVSELLLSNLRNAVTKLRAQLGPSVTSNECSPPWEAVTPSMCLLFTGMYGRWAASRGVCRSKGADLVLPLDKAEVEAVWKFAKRKKSTFVWLGWRRDDKGKFSDKGGRVPSWLPGWKADQPSKAKSYGCTVFNPAKGTTLIRRECSSIWPEIFCEKRIP